MTALPTFATEANALQTDVNNKQSLAASSQSAAATSETNAAASAAAAAASSVATIWISGTTYAIGDVRFSPTDYQSYRRKTAGAGTTDPKLDLTNWQRLGMITFDMIHVREEQNSGVSPSTSGGSGTFQMVLNTQVLNTITGASLGSNSVTLPAGTYDVEISGAANGVSHQASLFNTTDAAVQLIGTSATSSGGNVSRSYVSGRFTITSSKVLKVNQWVSANANFGASVNSGLREVYTEAKFWKVG